MSEVNPPQPSNGSKLPAREATAREVINQKARLLVRRLKANEEFRATPASLRRAIIKAALSETGILRQPVGEQISVIQELLAEPVPSLNLDLSASIDTIRRDLEKIRHELGHEARDEKQKTKKPSAKPTSHKPATSQAAESKTEWRKENSIESPSSETTRIAMQDDIFGGSQ